MEEEKKKKRNKYAFMIVKEHEDGAITTHHIGSTLVEAALIVISVIVVFVLCKLIYDGIVLRDYKKQVVNQLVTINELTETNNTLTIENDTLSSKVSVLSETVTKKAATEEAINQEETENATPKGFPLSGGTSTMESAESDGNPLIKFTVTSGINIVSSGTGTVLAIEDDAEYGYRIIIDHGNGYKSIYRNQGEVLVKVGDSLGKGYILYSVKKDNTDFGYQIMLDDQYVDPMEVLEING